MQQHYRTFFCLSFQQRHILGWCTYDQLRCRLFNLSSVCLDPFPPGNIFAGFIFLSGGLLTCEDFKQGSAEHAPSNISAFHFTHSGLKTCLQLGFVLVLPKLLSKQPFYSQNPDPDLQIGPQLGQSNKYLIVIKMIQTKRLFWGWTANFLSWIPLFPLKLQYYVQYFQKHNQNMRISI